MKFAELRRAYEVARTLTRIGVRSKVRATEGGFCVVHDKPVLVTRLQLGDEMAARDVEDQFRRQGFATERRGVEVRAYDAHI